MKEIPIITDYKTADGILTDFDPTANLDLCSPVMDTLPGWEEDISGCRTFDELPINAQNYIQTLEALLHTKIQFISVGADRDSYLTTAEWL